jgi:hypothetical protein
MKRSLKFATLVMFIAVTMSSCFSISHTVGSGSSTGETVKKKQWYILFGAIPLTKVDTKAMAGNATNYTVTTKFKFVDLLVGAVTSIVTIKPMTVEVKK